EISLLESTKPSYDFECLKLHPGEAHAINVRIRGVQLGQARVSARATIIDLRGHSKLIEVPCALFVVEREGRVPTGSSIADSLLLGGLPKRSAVLLTSAACDEKDNLAHGFCAIGPGATVYVSSDVDRSMQLHKHYPEL